jgi:putative ABC transport system permease protein
LLIEQTALPVLGAVTNGPLTVQMPSGRTSSIEVAGVVSDRALAPAWQEQRGYGYITPDTLAWLGEPPTLDQLKISVADQDRFDADAIERTARQLSGWLQSQGRSVEEIRIPPPGEHPHQRLMNALVTVLLLFSGLLLALSAVVIATLVTGMVSRHVRQIGAMKAIGASARQVGAMYGMMMLLIATLTVLVSLPLSTLAGQRLAEVFATLSNVELRSDAVPPFAYAIEIAVGLSLPLLAATMPIVKASRMTVREAVTEIGLFSLLGGARSRWLPGWLTRALGPTLALGVRNVVRRRGRLGLSLGLLAVGGGTFMAGLNVAAAADARMAAMEASRGYDVDVQLNRPANTDSLLQLWAVSATTRFPNRLVAGRSLEPGETDAVVVGRSTLNALQTGIGGTVALAIDGRITRWRVVGTVEGFGLSGGSGVFATDAGFAQAMGTVGQTRGLRIETTRHDSASRDATMSELTRALTPSNLAIVDAIQAEWINTVLRNHIAILQAALQLLGIVVGGVGVFTLASAMSTSVAERAREFGVMQTLGATPTRISLVVMFEGLLIGLLSWAGAIAVGAVLSSLLGVFVGVFLFDAALPLTVASLALGAWLVIALLGCAVAGLIPASVAARMTIRESLAYS